MQNPEGWTSKPHDFDELIEDREFLSRINNFKSNRWWIGQAYKESLKESRKVHALIKDELAIKN